MYIYIKDCDSTMHLSQNTTGWFLVQGTTIISHTKVQAHGRGPEKNLRVHVFTVATHASFTIWFVQ